MLQKSKNNLLIASKIIVLALLIGVSSYVLAQWAPPTQSPPGGNVSLPLNTSNLGQEKLGGLVLNTGTQPGQYGLIVANNSIGVSTRANGRYQVEIGDNRWITFYEPDWGLDEKNFTLVQTDITNGKTGYGYKFSWRTDNNPFVIGNNRADAILFDASGEVYFQQPVTIADRDVGHVPGYSLVLSAGERSGTGKGRAVAWETSSDRALKSDITPLSDALSKVLKLRGVSFKWKNDIEENKNNIGFIAQEVEQIFPELVSGKDGDKSVNYDSLVPVLVEAVKELNQKNQELEKRILDLENSVLNP